MIRIYLAVGLLALRVHVVAQKRRAYQGRHSLAVA
jgi:hypothetical protein